MNSAWSKQLFEEKDNDAWLKMLVEKKEISSEQFTWLHDLFEKKVHDKGQADRWWKDVFDGKSSFDPASVPDWVKEHAQNDHKFVPSVRRSQRKFKTEEKIKATPLII